MPEPEAKDHFKRNGKPKLAYHDAPTAERAAILSDKRVYRCPFCGALHLGGHADRSEARRQLRQQEGAQ